MNKEEFLALIDKYLAGETNAREEEWLRQYYQQFIDNMEWNESELGDRHLVQNALLVRLQQQLNEEDDEAIIITRNSFRRKLVWAAAVFIAVFATGWLLINHHESKKPLASVVPGPKIITHDRQPGGNKAILTLNDGSKITLDDAHTGLITREGGSEVKKTAANELVYHNPSGTPPREINVISYNTLTTPRGGQYQLLLPDGSRVWLNSASSIRYPTVFMGDQRVVEITGEAYFEVSHNPGVPAPFIVRISTGAGKKQSSVQVLGTHFNIMAYDEEETIQTTLFSGSVRFSQDSASRILKPGEQSAIDGNGTILVDPHANTDQAIAWKRGFFQFEGADLRTVMRQLARWYDVDIVYQPGIPERKFEGQIRRELRLSSVLAILQASNVHFRIDGKELTVLP